MAITKIFRRSTPAPRACLGVQANSVHSCGVRLASVHACSAGNVNDRFNVSLESRAGLVDWLVGIPYQLTNVAWRMERLALVTCWQSNLFLTASAKHG